MWGERGLASVEVAKSGGLQVSARAFHLAAGMGASAAVRSEVFRYEAPKKLEKAESKRIGARLQRCRLT